MRIKMLLKSFTANERGMAAVEMGLIFPILAFGFLLMADVGTAVGGRMELDRNVRAGVQAVMSNINDPDGIKAYVIASADDATNLSVAVDKTCKCGGTAASCTSWCSSTVPPAVFLNISAAKPYTGYLLPQFDLKSATHVQLR